MGVSTTNYILSLLMMILFMISVMLENETFQYMVAGVIFVAICLIIFKEVQKLENKKNINNH